VAGGGRAGFVGDGGLATNALLSGPTGVAIDSTGNLFIADSRNHRIRRLDRSTGVITTVAGTGNPGFSGDGGPGVLAWLNGPSGVAVDQDQNLLIADSHNKRIRRVDAKTGIIATVAGTGKAGFSGDGGPATAARLDAPTGVAVDARGNLYIADLFNRRIRRVDASTGIMTTVPAFAEEGVEGGLVSPRGIAVNQERNLFIADQGDHRIRRIDAITGMMTTVAGDAQKGFAGDGAPATGARLSSPRGVAVDAAGNLFIADSENHGIRAVKAP
jgi:DNA-binding beta-propeller fold protein YncE